MHRSARPRTPAENSPTTRALKEHERYREVRAKVAATLKTFISGLPLQSERDAKQHTRIWNVIRQRAAYKRDYARLRKLLGGHTNWSAATGPSGVIVAHDGVAWQVAPRRQPRQRTHVSPAAFREVVKIARRWGEILGPELPDPALPADELPAATGWFLRASCFSISIPFREDWAPGEDPVFANEIVLRIRPWASTRGVIAAYHTARRELLSIGSRFVEGWRAAEKKVRDVGGSAEGERRSRDPNRDDLIRRVHALHAHENSDRKHSFPWLASKFQKAVSTMYLYHQLGRARCPICNPPSK